MNDYGGFHDGWFEGIWLDGKSAHIFVATERHDPHVITADGVLALKIDDLRQGNIILDISVRRATEICSDDLDFLLYDLDDPKEREQSKALLEKARGQQLSLLQISPSYGAACIVLASAFELVTRQAWAERHRFAPQC